MNTREFVEKMGALCHSENQRLVGDISTGYAYLDTDEVQIRNMMSSAIKQAMNGRFGILTDAGKHCPNWHISGVFVPAIKKVHFNDPVTVVIWTDGTKTIVRCGEGESYDPEKGLAMAIAKKALGNKGNYYEVFKKWLPETETASEQIATNSKELPGSLYTVKEYCEKHRLSRDKVYKMIKSGELKAEKEFSGVWIIYE